MSDNINISEANERFAKLMHISLEKTEQMSYNNKREAFFNRIKQIDELNIDQTEMSKFINVSKTKISDYKNKDNIKYGEVPFSERELTEMEKICKYIDDAEVYDTTEYKFNLNTLLLKSNYIRKYGYSKFYHINNKLFYKLIDDAGLFSGDFSNGEIASILGKGVTSLFNNDSKKNKAKNNKSEGKEISDEIYNKYIYILPFSAIEQFNVINRCIDTISKHNRFLPEKENIYAKLKYVIYTGNYEGEDSHEEILTKYILKKSVDFYGNDYRISKSFEEFPLNERKFLLDEIEKLLSNQSEILISMNKDLILCDIKEKNTFSYNLVSEIIKSLRKINSITADNADYFDVFDEILSGLNDKVYKNTLSYIIDIYIANNLSNSTISRLVEIFKNFHIAQYILIRVFNILQESLIYYVPENIIYIQEKNKHDYDDDITAVDISKCIEFQRNEFIKLSSSTQIYVLKNALAFIPQLNSNNEFIYCGYKFIELYRKLSNFHKESIKRRLSALPVCSMASDDFKIISEYMHMSNLPEYDKNIFKTKKELNAPIDFNEQERIKIFEKYLMEGCNPLINLMSVINERLKFTPDEWYAWALMENCFRYKAGDEKYDDNELYKYFDWYARIINLNAERFLDKENCIKYRDYFMANHQKRYDFIAGFSSMYYKIGSNSVYQNLKSYTVKKDKSQKNYPIKQL